MGHTLASVHEETREATLLALDRTRREGIVETFAPDAPSFTVFDEDEDTVVTVPTDSLAAIVFHREAADPPVPETGDVLAVHVHGYPEPFVVYGDAATLREAKGGWVQFGPENPLYAHAYIFPHGFASCGPLDASSDEVALELPSDELGQYVVAMKVDGDVIDLDAPALDMTQLIDAEDADSAEDMGHAETSDAAAHPTQDAPVDAEEAPVPRPAPDAPLETADEPARDAGAAAPASPALATPEPPALATPATGAIARPALPTSEGDALLSQESTSDGIAIDLESTEAAPAAVEAAMNIPFQPNVTVVADELEAVDLDLNFDDDVRSAAEALQVIRARTGELRRPKRPAEDAVHEIALDADDALPGVRSATVKNGVLEVPADERDHVSKSLNRRARLGELLVSTGVLKDTDVEAALAEQKLHPELRLGETMIAMGLISEGVVASVLALKFGLPYIDLSKLPIDPAAFSELPLEVITAHKVLPVAADEHEVTVIITDPLDVAADDAMRASTNKRIVELLAKRNQVVETLNARLALEGIDNEAAFGMGTGLDDAEELIELGIAPEDEEHEDVSDLEDEAHLGPVVRLVNRIISDGLVRRASDIHLLPRGDGLLVAHRIDGDLLGQSLIDKRLSRQLISRLKILADMDIAERRMPQDGRIKLTHRGRPVELRVSSIPNVFGESIVMRVLERESSVDIGRLGFGPADSARLNTLALRPHGLILVTGPTGSGKSTTLAGIMKAQVSRPLHILSIEDPVERDVPGVNQIQVNHKIKLSFARILRNVLRHDPDVIMVGEMRDEETAHIGVEAALTGHLMLSTLHANSAVDTIVRLEDLGVHRALMAPALLGIVSQTLVKTLCPDCRTEVEPSDTVKELLEEHELPTDGPFYDKVGCASCGGRGYRGRTLLYEFLEVNRPVRAAIEKGLSGPALEQVAKDHGMVSKGHRALQMANAGQITATDLLRYLL